MNYCMGTRQETVSENIAHKRQQWQQMLDRGTQKSQNLNSGADKE